MSSRRQSILALALLGTALLSVWFGILEPGIRGIHERKARLAQLTVQTTRFAAGAERWQKRQHQAVDTVIDSAASEDIFLPIKDAEIAAVQVQQTLREICQTNGAELMTSQLMRPDIHFGYSRSAVQASIRATLPAFVEILLALKRSRPLLSLEYYSVGSSVTSGNTQPQRTGSNLSTLAINLTVTAYLAPKVGSE